MFSSGHWDSVWYWAMEQYGAGCLVLSNGTVFVIWLWDRVFGINVFGIELLDKSVWYLTMGMVFSISVFSIWLWDRVFSIWLLDRVFSIWIPDRVFDI